VGLLERAETLIKLKRAIFGDEHGEVAESLALIGNSCRRRNDWIGASRWTEQAAVMLERLSPASSLHVVNCYSAAAEGYRMVLDPPKETELSLRAVENMRRLPAGSVEPMFRGAVLRDAASALARAKRFEEFEQLMREALAVFVDASGNQGHVVATTHARFADGYLFWGKRELAIEHAKAAIAMGEHAASMPQDQRISMYSTYAMAMVLDGNLAEAHRAAVLQDELCVKLYAPPRSERENEHSLCYQSNMPWVVAVVARARGESARAQAAEARSRQTWRTGSDWLFAEYGVRPAQAPPWEMAAFGELRATPVEDSKEK
jgi:hypothetical protein